MNVSGEKIKQCRQRQGLTQVRVAQFLGITQSTYAQYESGKRHPKIETVKRIADALEVPWTDLCDDVDEHTRFVAGVEYAKNIAEARQGVEKAAQIFARALGSPFERDMEDIREVLETMNDKGREAVLHHTKELAMIPEYKKE